MQQNSSSRRLHLNRPILDPLMRERGRAGVDSQEFSSIHESYLLYGSAQEFDEVPNWRGFQDFGLSDEASGLDDRHLSPGKRPAVVEPNGLVRCGRSSPGLDGCHG
jgi:hypothetical protein